MPDPVMPPVLKQSDFQGFVGITWINRVNTLG